jgi:hypothetical protein
MFTMALSSAAFAHPSVDDEYAHGTLIVEGDVVSVTPYRAEVMRSVKIRVTSVLRGAFEGDIEVAIPGGEGPNGVWASIPHVPYPEAGEHVIIALSPGTNTEVPGGSWRFSGGVYLSRAEHAGRLVAFNLDGRLASWASCEGGIGTVPSNVSGFGMTREAIRAAVLAAGGPGAPSWSELVAGLSSCVVAVPASQIR